MPYPRSTNPGQYVGNKWNTSKTKVLDNAVVGAVCLIERQRASPALEPYRAAAFLLAVLLGIARAGRQRREAPVRGKGCIDDINVGIIEACPDNRCLQIVMPNVFGTPPRSVHAFLCRRRKVSRL